MMNRSGGGGGGGGGGADDFDKPERKRAAYSNPEEEPPVELNADFRNVIIIDGLPRVDDAKYEKLVQVISGNKWCGQFGEIVEFMMPKGDDGLTVGYAFCEYKEVVNAERAIAELDNKKFDRQHTLRVNSWSDFEMLSRVLEEFEFKMEDHEQKDTQNWLLDLDGRDQYCIRHENETEVYWNDPLKFRDQNFREVVTQGEEHKSKGKTWTEYYTGWSARGSYFATFHNQGIVFWGGDRFEKRGRFAHPGVKLMETSPRETYLITCNMRDQARPEDPECAIIWDIRTGKKLRGFDSVLANSWPVFKWSHDDKYVARIAKDREGKDAIFIYELPEMNLLDKKSIKVANVKDIQWSPTDNILGYWVPEQDNIPATVSLLEIPSKRTVREKHLYGVSDIKMHWQNKGDYMCVKMARTKKQKVISSNFEIFRMRVKEIPVESLEVDQNIIAFSFEPQGHRFAIIVEGQGNQNTVDFYHIKKKKIELVYSLKNRSVNCLFWSPAGSNIVLAGLGPLKGEALEFFDADIGDTSAIRSHENCTDLEWDPSGRYVITSVTRPLGIVPGAWKFQGNGYRVFAYDGKGDGVWVERTKAQFDELYQILWRPRPPSLLTREQLDGIKTSLKDKYWRRFEAEDEKWRAHFEGAEAERRLHLKEDWKAYRSLRLKEFKEESEDRRLLRGGYKSDGEEEEESIDEVVEVVLSEETIMLSSDSLSTRGGSERGDRSARVSERHDSLREEDRD